MLLLKVSQFPFFYLFLHFPFPKPQLHSIVMNEKFIVKFELNLKISLIWMRRGYCTLAERKLAHQFRALANMYD